MISDNTISDILKVSYDVLKESKSLDVFPTPIKQIVSTANLTIASGDDLTIIHNDFFAQDESILKSALFKIRGILDRQHNQIFLEKSQGKERQNFVTLHEVGHHLLPWQGKVNALILEDDDDTLSPTTNEDFEAEANYFASATLFQLDRFTDKIHEESSISLHTVFSLAKVFGASRYATLRRYVEYSNYKCGLLVLSDVSPKGAFPKCTVKEIFLSTSFLKEFGDILIPNEIGYKWEFMKEYYHNAKLVKAKLITLPTSQGPTQFYYEFFNNSYNGFVFIYPFAQ